MTDAQELLTAVRARTEGTPYVVTETADGFDVHIDFQDPSWYGPLYEQHLSRTSIHHVKVERGSKTLSITDDVRTVRWSAGVQGRSGLPTPVLSAGVSRSLGRLPQRRVQVTWSRDGRGARERSVDEDSGTAEGRHLIRDPARELGWTEKRGVPERVGLYVGVGTIVLLVLAGLVVGIVALAGGF